MSIKCGNCKDYHETVAAVRFCCANVERKSFQQMIAGIEMTTPAIVKATEADTRLTRSNPVRDGIYGRSTVAVGSGPSFVPASVKQLEFLSKLCAERPQWTASRKVSTTDGKLSKFVASNLISEALNVPVETAAKPCQSPECPDGYFALTTDNVTRFYRVQNVTEGKWAGRTFVNVQASDEFYPLKDRAAAAAVLAAIAVDPMAAAALYGQKIGRCGICNRTLTDETSRAFGIGPICREKGF